VLDAEARSTNGSSYTTLVNSAGYTFNPASGNTVTITFTATNQRFARLNITANTGWQGRTGLRTRGVRALAGQTLGEKG
jgi:hypothetical protein